MACVPQACVSPARFCGAKPGDGRDAPTLLPDCASLIRATKKENEGSGTPTDAGCMKPCQRARRRATDQGRLAPTRPLSGALACRRSTTVPAEESVPSPRRGHGPGFMGDGAKRCGFATRQHRTHLQRCTSRAGPSAGGHDARAARERVVTPPAGTVLAPPAGLPSRKRPSLSESSGEVSETATNVKKCLCIGDTEIRKK